MSKFWFLIVLFSINPVENEKCCAAKIPAYPPKNIHKAIGHDTTNDCNTPIPNQELNVLNTTATPVNEKPAILYPALLNKNIPPEPSPIRQQTVATKSPRTIKLTKSGTIYFMKNLEEAINTHPVLSTNANVIKELLHEAVENATIALREAAKKQQKEAVLIEEKDPSRILMTEPAEVCQTNAISSINTNIPMKQKAPVHQHGIVTPHEVNESKVIACDDTGKKIKLNASLILKHDDENVTSQNTKHDPCPTKVSDAENNLHNQVFEAQTKNEPISGNNNEKPGSLLDPVKNKQLHLIDEAETPKTRKTDPLKTGEKRIGALQPKLTIPATELDIDKMEIELPLYEDESDAEEKTSETMDIEDKFYEETYSKDSDDARYSLRSRVCPHGWYTNPYYQRYNQQLYQSCSSYDTYNPRTCYVNPGPYIIEQSDANGNILSYEQNNNAYRNHNTILKRQLEHNDLLSRRWWGRKVRFFKGPQGSYLNNNMDVKHETHLINANRIPNYDRFKRNLFRY